ncbi:hypothetical protein Tco_0002079 [Tanacetum coccineum]
MLLVVTVIVGLPFTSVLISTDVLVLPLSFLAGSLSDFWMDMVETIVSAISSMMSCGDEWVDMMVLYCQSSAVDNQEFARRINALLWEMVVAYDDRVDFIRVLESVTGVIAAVKTAKFLNEIFWKDDRKLQKLWNMEMVAKEMAFDKDCFIQNL